jgi:serine protease AprX
MIKNRNLMKASSWGAVLLSFTLAAGGASAGELVKLKSGALRLDQQSFFSTTLNTSAPANFIVQFNKTATATDKKMLVNLGAKIYSYLPDDAYLVKATPDILSQFKKNNPNVKGFALYSAGFKMSPQFNNMSVFNSQKTRALLVKTFEAQDARELAQAAQKMGATKIYADGKFLRLQLPDNALWNFAQNSGIEFIEPYFEMETFKDVIANSDVSLFAYKGDYSDLDGYQSGTKVMDFEAAWAAGFTGKGQIASMADTGLDTGDMATIHPDFTGAIPTGFFFGLFAKSWEDPMGHGTHVAGSIVGRGTHSNGLLKGGAYDAQFIPEGMWSPMAENLTVPPKLDKLFDSAYKAGARIHSNSWGSPKSLGAYDAFASQVDEYVWNNDDMLIVFAAGNSGTDMDKDGRIDPGSVSSPGTAKNSLTVGASENLNNFGGIQAYIKDLKVASTNWPAEPISSSKMSDNENGIAMFSSRGPTLDGRFKPDIVAPGTNILSTKSSVKDSSPLWGAYNDKYAYSGGTSMACPLAAGGATVARQYIAEKFGFANPSAAAIKALLMNTAIDLYPGQYGEVGVAKGQEILTHKPNTDQGFGRINMKNVVDSSNNSKLVDNRTGVKEGSQEKVSFVVNRPTRITATLVYSDAPASPSAATSLINNLSLTIVKPNGEAVKKDDLINNSEYLDITLEPGQYQLIVKGEKVPQLKNGNGQPYALFYSLF